MSKFLLALLVAVCGIGYWYYTDTQARILTLQENNIKLQVAVETSEAALKETQENLKKAAEEMQKVNAEFQQIRAQNNVLSTKLSRHDIGVLASKKPGLVEKTINKASGKAARCFELLSGSELTEEEKNATSAKAFNSECPWLWTGGMQSAKPTSATN